MISDLKEEFKNLKVIGQPIIPVDTERDAVKEYELLLRARENDRFPTELFSKIIIEQIDNHLFLNWLSQQVNQILINNPRGIYNINLDPQQFNFEETWQFVTAISQHRSRLKIEITERIPFNDGQVDLAEVVRHIKMTGLAVALDDICTGENCLGFVVKNYKSLKRIKFSVLDFRMLKKENLKRLLSFLLEFSLDAELEFVIEGMTQKEVRQIYAQRCNHQSENYHLFWQAAKEINF